MIRLKPFRQSAGLCGPASLKMVLEYYGVVVSEAVVARAAGATRTKGISKNGLIKAAKHFGFKVFAKERSTFRELGSFLRKGVPVIVDWFSESEGHYSVVIALDGKKITLMDPELGSKRQMPLHDFWRLWFDFPGDYLENPQDLVLRLMIVVEPKG